MKNIFGIYLALMTFVEVSLCTSTLSYADVVEVEEKAEADLSDYSQSREWLRLMHYVQERGHIESRVVNDDFFVSPEGRNQPLKELTANIDLLRQKQAAGPNHPQCRYPARYEFLSSRFQLAEPVECIEMQNWFKEYQPTKVSYVYTSQYISSPMSVFGHSFLLFSSDSIPEYLWATFNYAADIPGDTNPVAYSYKGLTGGFWGQFDIMPFYKRIEIYTHYENRDLWIYDIDFSKREVQLIAKVIWELAHEARLRYFFLDENCAGILLSVIEIVRPQLNLLNEFGLFIPPGEISKPLIESGLSKDVRLKPSIFRQLNLRMQNMSQAQIKNFHRARVTHSLDEQVKKDAETLELLMVYFDFLYAKNKGVLSEQTLQFKQQTFSARAKLGASTQSNSLTKSLERTLEEAPHTSHKTMRAQIGGIAIDENQGVYLGLRPAIHGFLDLQNGYLRDSEIAVLNTEVFIDENEKIKLHDLTFVSIKNFQSISRVIAPLSWSAKVSIMPTPYLADSSYYVGYGMGGVGYSVSIDSLHLKYFALLQLQAMTGHLGEYSPIMAGPQVGQILDLNKFRWLISMDYKEPILKTEYGHELGVENEIRYALGANWHLNLQHRYAKLPPTRSFAVRTEEQSSVVINYFFNSL